MRNEIRAQACYNDATEEPLAIFWINNACSDLHRKLEVPASGRRQSLDALRWTQELPCFCPLNNQNFSAIARELMVALESTQNVWPCLICRHGD